MLDSGNCSPTDLLFPHISPPHVATFLPSIFAKPIITYLLTQYDHNHKRKTCPCMHFLTSICECFSTISCVAHTRASRSKQEAQIPVSANCNKSGCYHNQLLNYNGLPSSNKLRNAIKQSNQANAASLISTSTWISNPSTQSIFYVCVCLHPCNEKQTCAQHDGATTRFYLNT